MPTPDQTRIAADRARPRIMELWWALRPLTSVIRFMQSGAHPDDEITAMLAALAFRDGINLSYACSTRGEGGQNDIGTEAGADLGALRTREMERACDILGMRMYWLSEDADDPIRDFGFSKSGVETLGKWGHERTVARFVEVIRTERPDILCPTFLDIPGQHGHHRAMTQAAHEVMALAADPAFSSNLPPWQVAKLYLPAWSGAGGTYDDDLPPPPATLTVKASGKDPVSGWTWERIGQQSRAFHRTQGMGRWVPPGQGRDFPLHLAESRVAGLDKALSSGLPATVADLADLAGIGNAAEHLRQAGKAIDRTISAFPDFEKVANAAAEALTAVRDAQKACPPDLRPAIMLRLDAKETQLGHVLRVALGIEAHARTAGTWLHPGDTTALTVETTPGTDYALDLPKGWNADGGALTITGSAGPTPPYPVVYDPAHPAAPAIVLSLSHAHVTTKARLPVDGPVVLPQRLATPSPDATIVNLAARDRSIPLELSGLHPVTGTPGLSLPVGWTATRTQTGFDIVPPKDVAPGLYSIPILVDGEPAQSVREIAYPHIAPTARAQPAILRVRVLDVAVPQTRIGYVGSGNDRVGHWLGVLGADVTDLTNIDLASETALAEYGAIVIGIFALRFRPGLTDHLPRLHNWVLSGGTLVTLYHRPWDNWDPDRTPPKQLEIGQPSLRWRVTDETATVTHLGDHPVLNEPNVIGPADWDGWVKERGLYFAKSWDDAYVPLVEMADADERPHKGALLSAEIGDGRHTHCALTLHLQMENLVPGGFRLMANLVASKG